jgi:hypothetical protein
MDKAWIVHEMPQAANAVFGNGINQNRSRLSLFIFLYMPS